MGNAIYLNAPLEYDLIMNVCGSEPSADLIEAISYSSINPYFKGAIFRKLLIKYRKNGCCQSIPIKPPSAEKILKYAYERRLKMSRPNQKAR